MKLKWKKFSKKMCLNSTISYCIIYCHAVSMLVAGKILKKKCPLCNTEEDIKHLIYDCNLTKLIWDKVSNALNFNITWKNVVFGFYLTCNNTSYLYNNMISFVAYKLYKYKMKCKILNEIVTFDGAKCFLKNACTHLYLSINLSKCVTCNFDIIKKIIENLV
jgi:hypothetical protein